MSDDLKINNGPLGPAESEPITATSTATTATSPTTSTETIQQPTTLDEIKKMLSQLKFEQVEQQPENNLNVDIIKGSPNDFINYKSTSSDYEAELKAHLMLRNPELQAQHIEMVVAEAKDLMMRDYELTQQLPENPAKTVRKNTLLILKKVKERQEALENIRIESAAIQYNIAEREFGANYVKEKKIEAENFIAEQLDIPVEELRDFPPERYSKLLKSYSRRNNSVQEIDSTNKGVSDFKQKLKNRF